MDEEELISITEAAERIGVSVATMRRAVRMKQVKRAKKIGAYWAVYESEARAWKNSPEFHTHDPHKNKSR